MMRGKKSSKYRADTGKRKATIQLLPLAVVCCHLSAKVGTGFRARHLATAVSSHFDPDRMQS